MEKRNKEVLIADTISAVTWTEPSVPSVGKSAEMSSCNCQCSVTGLLRPMLRQWGQGQWYKLRQAQGSMDQSHEAQRCCLGQVRQEPSSLANAMEDSQAESMELFENWLSVVNDIGIAQIRAKLNESKVCLEKKAWCPLVPNYCL